MVTRVLRYICHSSSMLGVIHTLPSAAIKILPQVNTYPLNRMNRRILSKSLIVIQCDKTFNNLKCQYIKYIMKKIFRKLQPLLDIASNVVPIMTNTESI